MNQYHPDDRPAANEQPIRARVPDHVSAGAFSTGVIVMTAHTEVILDFVQNLGRPHQIVARVVMPHTVLPQLVDALQRNIELYRARWGDLPETGLPTPPPADPEPKTPWGGVQHVGLPEETGEREQKTAPPQKMAGGGAAPAGSAGPGPASSGPASSSPGGAAGGGSTGKRDADRRDADSPSDAAVEPPGGSEDSRNQPPREEPKLGTGTRQATAEEVYDDLKIKDELLSGAYANAVMIGHGAHEFSFDFITNFYPHSAVSTRVFLAAGQVPRLYDSLKGTWDQMRLRPGRGPTGGNGPDAAGPGSPGPNGPGTGPMDGPGGMI